MTLLYLQLFYTFFKIGLFGFGGGYAMLSLIQGEIVSRYEWLTPQEFTDIVAVSQMTPGPIGINSATYVGYAATGSIWGSVIATFAVMLPSFVLMLTISRFILKYREHPIFIGIFAGLRPAIVGLLAAAALLLMTSDNFGSLRDGNDYTFIISIAIFVGVFIGARYLRINPILLILLSGLIGLLVY
ncbi:MAG: chromate transporter [Prevotellaceae bacterium]|jgi:chromate transporter|nr:chromate transporter [Prevotellaceae bacterium]